MAILEDTNPEVHGEEVYLCCSLEKGDYILLKSYRSIWRLSHILSCIRGRSRIASNVVLKAFRLLNKLVFKKASVLYIHCGRLYRTQRSNLPLCLVFVDYERLPIRWKHRLCFSLFSGAVLIIVEVNAYQQIGQSTENEVYIEMDLLNVGSEPIGMRCPYCQDDVMTRALYKNSTITHLVALILGVFLWWLCCCIVPYLMKRWKNVEHYCPNCNKFLGVYTRTTIM